MIWSAVLPTPLDKNFFVASLQIDTVHGSGVFWGVFKGQPLDAPMTTRRQTFEVWHVFLTLRRCGHGTGASIRLDASAGCLYVTAVNCHLRKDITRG